MDASSAGTGPAGRRALVTGAGSGIGKACARALARAGAHVIALDVDGAAAEATARDCCGSALQHDLRDLDGIEALPGLGSVDVLVNNAGLQHVAPIEDFDPGLFSAIVEVMLEAPFRLLRAVLPGMYERGWGRVVNISSVHGLRASPFKSAYVAAKHGLEGLSKVVALEGGPRGVTSNCVCPAYVRTPLVEGQIRDQARAHGISEGEVVERVMLAETAIKRLLEPEEVAAAVLFLCSEAGASCNGSSLVMDGGWTAR